MTLATSWKARTLSRRQFSSPRPKPTTTPAQRFAVGKEEQRNECALTFVKKSEQAIYSLLRRGDPAGIRTPDPLLKRQLLCRLSYRIMSIFKCKTPAALIGLAGTAGLEPADEGVKVPCLTTWRRPNVERSRGPGLPRSLARVWGG